MFQYLNSSLNQPSTDFIKLCLIKLKYAFQSYSENSTSKDFPKDKDVKGNTFRVEKFFDKHKNV